MQVLVVSAVFPYPLHSGGQIRLYNLLKRVSKIHDITLVSYVRDRKEAEYRDKLSFCKEIHTIYRGRAWQPGYLWHALVGKYPFLLATYENDRAKALLSRLIDTHSYRLIHLEPFYVWPALPPTKLPIVVSEHNIEYTVYERYAKHVGIHMLRPLFLWDVSKIHTWERLVWRNAAALTAVSQEDARVMETYLSRDVTVVPNGVDLSQFSYKAPEQPVSKQAVFVGNFRWLPNRQAAKRLVSQVWPAIRAEHPDARLRIVGRHIPAELRRRFERAGATVDADVADITAVYHQADVLLAPHAIGGGTKYKMLEAMASGLPVVTTKQGMAGLNVEPGVHYMEAHTPKEYAEAVTRLWDSPDITQRMTKEARYVIEKTYGWDAIATTLDRVWRKVK